MTENSNTTDKTILGLDVGTSGIRASIVKVIHHNKITSTNSVANNALSIEIIDQQELAMPIPQADIHNEILQSPETWIKTLDKVLKKLGEENDLGKITHFIADATSSTVLLTDAHNTPLTSAIMYNDSRSIGEAYLIKQLIEKAYLQHCIKNNQGAKISALDDIEININETSGTLGIGAMGSSSSLAKSLRLNTKLPAHNKKHKIYHQLDFINQHLADCNHTTDENNALKLGFDSIKFAWPSWVQNLADNLNLSLPKVVKPGSQIGKVKSDICRLYGFNKDLKIMAGTTDSIAGFLAAGATGEGQAVVSLGSTIAVKLITNKPVFSPQHGLYSHRLGDKWLVGGASNAGGKIFLQDYTEKDLAKLTKQQPNNLITQFASKYVNDFYPLSEVGERFPISDNQRKPQLPNKPSLDANLEQHQKYIAKLSLGLASIEFKSFKLLESLSDTNVKQIFSVGGGLKNEVWQQFRKHLLNVDIQPAEHQNASIGVTKLLWK